MVEENFVKSNEIRLGRLIIKSTNDATIKDLVKTMDEIIKRHRELIDGKETSIDELMFG